MPASKFNVKIQVTTIECKNANYSFNNLDQFLLSLEMIAIPFLVHFGIDVQSKLCWGMTKIDSWLQAKPGFCKLHIDGQISKNMITFYLKCCTLLSFSYANHIIYPKTRQPPLYDTKLENLQISSSKSVTNHFHNCLSASQGKPKISIIDSIEEHSCLLTGCIALFLRRQCLLPCLISVQ